MSNNKEFNLSIIDDWELFFENVQNHISFDSKIENYKDKMNMKTIDIDEDDMYKKSEEILVKLGIRGFSKKYNTHCWGK